MDPLSQLLFSFFLTLHLSALGVVSTTFTMINKCDYTVWPGILTNAGITPLSITGFALQTDESKSITTPSSWGGRFWGRTHCSQGTTGKFSCVTGDCGSGKLECAGNGAAPPATLAEFTLDGAGGLDFFDVSLVDGYNVPMLVVPQGGSGDNCTSTGCVGDLNGACPLELKVMSVDGKESVACKSACEAFGTAQYCCSGAFGSPNTCKPSAYSEIFKNACPRAYSYAYDDKTSTFTCALAPDYTITFCPSHDSNPSQKSWHGQNPKSSNDNGSSPNTSTSPPSTQHNNSDSNSTVYVGALVESEISWATSCTHHVWVSWATSCTHHVWESQAITTAIWLLCQFF